MKKLSMFLAALAMTVAVASAFAFDKSAQVEDPAWIDTSGTVDICEPAIDVECGGGKNLCVKSINGNPEVIYDFDTTPNCGVELYMP